MWEEFTQSIHTFIKNKKNLAHHTQGKKKATLIVIPSVRFTKLIIYYLQSKHKFHPRPDSPLHLPNEEPNAYLEKVAKHQRYLAGEEVSDLDSPTPKPSKATKPKATKKSKPLVPKAALIIKPAATKASKYGSKGIRPALSISKMKAAYYPDVGLEQMVPDQMWIEEECKYDVAAMYGVRTHMRILSVVRIEVFSLYGYDYMKTIILRRADLQEHIIAEKDFKYLYPSDFEDLYLLNLQGHLNHLPPKDKKILTTAVNLWTRNLVIRQQHDFTVIDSSRAVTFQDKYGVQMIMRFNEIHKFTDGTLQ
ncbi:hypothetical protein Tco_0912815 [Tanacetum coccineum]